MLTLCIDRQGAMPVYEQVADQLRRLIVSGELEPGATLPPVRRLAGDLGVGLNTVARAYRTLADEGFLLTSKRSRVQVAAPAERAADAPSTHLLDDLRLALARLRQSGVTSEELRRLTLCEVEALGFPKEESSRE